MRLLPMGFSFLEPRASSAGNRCSTGHELRYTGQHDAGRVYPGCVGRVHTRVVYPYHGTRGAYSPVYTLPTLV